MLTLTMPIDGDVMERLAAIARQKDASLEDTAHMAMVAGLDLLIGKKCGKRNRKPNKNTLRIREYILAHEGTQSDEEMGKALGRQASTIKIQRRIMKRIAKSGNALEKNGKADDGEPKGFWTPEKETDLKECFTLFTDGELAYVFGCSTQTIIRKRAELGLSRKAAKRRKKADGEDAFRDKISPERLRAMLLEEGKTEKNIGDAYGVSRERVRQVANECLIDVKDRKPIWYARKVGAPDELGTKDSFTRLLVEHNGPNGLETHLYAQGKRITVRWLRVQAARLEVDDALLHQLGELVQVACANADCGKTIYRRKQQYDLSKKKTFWCNRICQGRWIGNNHGFAAQGNIDEWSPEHRKFLEDNCEMPVNDIARHLKKPSAAIIVALGRLDERKLAAAQSAPEGSAKA